MAALLAEFTTALKDAGPMVSTTLLATATANSSNGASDPKPPTVGDRKRQLGEGASGSWADETIGGEEELL